jgi:hypothetical protein
LLGPYGQLVRLKPGETTKQNYDDSIKIKQSNLLSALFHFRLITKGLQALLDEMGLRIRNI